MLISVARSKKNVTRVKERVVLFFCTDRTLREEETMHLRRQKEDFVVVVAAEAAMYVVVAVVFCSSSRGRTNGSCGSFQ